LYFFEVRDRKIPTRTSSVFALEPVHESPNAVSHERHEPVQEVAEAAARHAEIGQNLSAVHWQQTLDGFVFDDHEVFDDHVDSISNVDPHGVVANRELHFALHVEPARSQLVGEALLI
jgi:hypothetical protein